MLETSPEPETIISLPPKILYFRDTSTIQTTEMKHLKNARSYINGNILIIEKPVAQVATHPTFWKPRKNLKLLSAYLQNSYTSETHLQYKQLTWNTLKTHDPTLMETS